MSEEYDWETEASLVDIDDSRARLSASSIKTHQSCPKRFELSRILKLPPATVDDKGYRQLGSAVHGAIEHILEDERWKEPPRHANQIRTELIAHFQETDPDVDKDLWDRGMNCLETASKWLTSPDFGGDMVFRDIEAEFEFSLGRADIQASFKGYIDATTEGTVIDWKTGNVREDDEVLQGAVYMRGYQELYGEPPDEILFVYLKEGKERSLEPSDENWSELTTAAAQVIQDIQREQFDPNPGSNCYWCDHSPWCEFDPAGSGAALSYTNLKRRTIKF